MPALREAANGFRVITVSSASHLSVSYQSMNDAVASNLDPADYSPRRAYGLSKAANVLFAKELQRRMDEARVRGSAISLCPGAANTEISRLLSKIWRPQRQESQKKKCSTRRIRS